jgi:hypothetical protein
LLDPFNVWPISNELDGQLETGVGEKGLQLKETLILRGWVTRPVLVQSLARRSKSLENQAGSFVGNVAEHPSILIEIAQLARLDLHQRPMSDRARRNFYGKNAHIRSGA